MLMPIFQLVWQQFNGFAQKVENLMQCCRIEQTLQIYSKLNHHKLLIAIAIGYFLALQILSQLLLY